MALPLAGMRVLEMTDGRGEGCGRFLADLGAEVVLVEPPGGARARHAEPSFGGESLAFAAGAANKRSIVLDLADPAQRGELLDLLAVADLWIDGLDPGALDAVGLDPASLRKRLPQLIVLSITDFGMTGPRRHWVATDWIHIALNSTLSRSGVPGQPPIMPPGRLPDAAVAVQGAWVALVAYWSRLETGQGDHLDLSVYEATSQVIDPPIGAIGTAAAAEPGASGYTTERGRQPGYRYPIFRCADGHVRVFALAARQWKGLFGWLGEPEEFSGPAFDNVANRRAASGRLYPLIQDLMAGETMMDLVFEGQRRGVPVAPVLDVGRVLDVEHFAVRGTFADTSVAGAKGKLASGYVIVDGERAGVRQAAPPAGQDNDRIDWAPRDGSAPPTPSEPAGALAGLRVLDLGVIVVGGEAGRLFGDQQADVIKVENSAYPDGARGSGMSANLASSQRNKRSVGINLRDPRGMEVFRRLVAVSDVVLTNFKPGTVESLGIGYDQLRKINPGIVLTTSSSNGEWGPWRDWAGYGPIVRCITGLTYLWNDVRVESGFGDGQTIYPDNLAGRITDIGALAALIARRKTGVGAQIESSQAEAIITAMAPVFLQESLQPGAAAPRVEGETNAPWAVFPCMGEDEWCVITVRNDDDWTKLVAAIGSPEWAADPALSTTAGRLAARQALGENMSAWTAARAPNDVAELLQAAGVPAAPMQRVEEWLADPQLRARGYFRTYRHPHYAKPIISEDAPCLAERMPPPPEGPAPLIAEHTREVCVEVLGMTDAEIDELRACGALE